MVKHIILWQFRDELSDDTKKVLGKEIKEKLEALQGRIPGLIDTLKANSDLRRL